MSRRRIVPIVIGIALLAPLAWAVTAVLERLAAPEPVAERPVTPAPAAEEAPHIAATLFYGSPQGDALVPVQRDVPLAEGIEAQGREIVAAQLQPAPEAHIATIPEGTTLRAFYVTERGDAFVDLSSEIATRHPGGSLNELLTVQTIVHAVTANLPAVKRVQITVDGKEVDTLAGHVDVRRPLTRDASLIRESEASP